MDDNKVIDALIGIAVGDAIGVPFEFSSREKMRQNPAKGMIGYGTYNQPLGTWSDDSSLTFCLAESLVNGYHLKDISENFIKWKNESYWSARGEVFDIGLTTRNAITRLQDIIDNNNTKELENLKYFGHELENGNGSLMRIMPLLFYIKGESIKTQFNIVWKNSALTHRHIRAAMSCMIYLKMAEYLISGNNKIDSYLLMRKDILEFWDEMEFSAHERKHFDNVIKHDIRDVSIKDLKTGGYVIEVLESSIWFFLNTNSYEEAILSIVNLGHDTDTAAAITGGLAGIYYGIKGIPDYWVASIARMEDIVDLGERLNSRYSKK